MKKAIISLAFLLSLLPLSAKVKMPHIFSDNMVLQADTVAMLWGYASPKATVRINGSWGADASVKTDKDGRWKVGIATPTPSYTPLTLTVSDSTDGDKVVFSNVLAGEVWLASGQSNMEMPLRGYLHQPIEGADDEIMFSSKLGKGIRLIKAPRAVNYEPQEDFEASWETSNPETVAEFSAVAWFFARYLGDIIDRPIGIINAAWGSSKVEGWIPAEILANYPDCDYNAERNNPDLDDRKRIGIMYNSMIHPVAGFTARGFLWNQGESNVGSHDSYPTRQDDMVRYWRQIWGNPDMQFYFVELPGYNYGNTDNINAALFREAQHKAEKLTPGSHIICTSDLVYPDEANDIHARNKRDIGKRLAAMAATYSYGVKGLPHKYPTVNEVEFRGNEAIISFNDARQGFTPNEDLQGFEVAGADKVFYTADAQPERKGRTITVSAPQVSDIKAVRYCFKNFAIGRLHNSYGLPLVPFRTDNWDD